MSPEILTIKNLNRRFGDVVANDDISIRVRPGEIVGLLGHNGAGKTTLVSQLVGLLKPHGGTIRVGDVDVVDDPAAARRHVALQPQSQAPVDGLTPRMAIEIAGRIRGLSRKRSRVVAEELADELDIGHWLDRKALPEGAGLSGGVRRLTAFAMAVAAPTPLLVLDEPTNDIDASRRRMLWEAVRRRGDEGCGVLLVTHNVNEAERIVDGLVVLDRGRVVAQGSPVALRGAADTDLRLELLLAPGNDDPAADPEQVPVPVVRRVRAGRRLLLTVASEDASRVVSWATSLRNASAIEGYSLAPATLEDAYLAVTNTSSTNEEQERAHA